MTKGCGRPKKPFKFNCNRPFIFVIHKYHKSKDDDEDEDHTETEDKDSKDPLEIYFMAKVDLNGATSVSLDSDKNIEPVIGAKRERTP